MLILYGVDLQNDFMNPDGALSVPCAEMLKPNIVRLIETAEENDIPIVLSMDRHFPGDIELKEFPPHCMDGTDGQHLIDEAMGVASYIFNRDNGDIEYPGGKDYSHCSDEKRIIIEKGTTDVFHNPHTAKILEALGVETAIVFGVATEYCVKAAVMGMKKRGIEVYLVKDAMEGVNMGAKWEAQSVMRAAGVHFSPTDYAIKLMEEAKK